MAINLGRPMQVLMPLCLLFMLTSVLIYPNKGSFGFYLILSSLGCMIITFIVTMTTELPIVNKIKLWTSDTAPSDWNEIRDKWVKFHALRVFPALISFGLYLIAILHSDWEDSNRFSLLKESDFCLIFNSLSIFLFEVFDFIYAKLGTCRSKCSLPPSELTIWKGLGT